MPPAPGSAALMGPFKDTSPIVFFVSGKNHLAKGREFPGFACIFTRPLSDATILVFPASSMSRFFFKKSPFDILTRLEEGRRGANKRTEQQLVS
jgi:hypothetical protein